jgi:hypothetical protein
MGPFAGPGDDLASMCVARPLKLLRPKSALAEPYDLLKKSVGEVHIRRGPACRAKKDGQRQPVRITYK